VANRKGYAGYESDGAVTDFLHVRYRLYRPALGRWTRRDMLGYFDGPSLYEYAQATPLVGSDPFGLWTNFNWFWHFYFGFGTPVDLEDVGLLEKYKNNHAIELRRAFVMFMESQRCRLLAASLLGYLDCNCPSSTGYSCEGFTIHQANMPVPAKEFIEWSPPISTDPWYIASNLMFTDWTVSIADHRLLWKSFCTAQAWCNAPDAEHPKHGTYIWNLTIHWEMKDAFADPLDLKNLLVGWYGEEFGMDIYKAVNHALQLHPGLNWMTGFPYKITGKWTESASGGGSAEKSKDGCLNNE
jgi:RHS repeat-associated protein